MLRNFLESYRKFLNRKNFWIANSHLETDAGPETLFCLVPRTQKDDGSLHC